MEYTKAIITSDDGGYVVDLHSRTYMDGEEAVTVLGDEMRIDQIQINGLRIVDIGGAMPIFAVEGKAPVSRFTVDLDKRRMDDETILNIETDDGCDHPVIGFEQI